MSEIAPVTTVTESAPTSTADVAEAVIDSYEPSTPDSDDVAVSGETPAPAMEAQTVEAPEPAPGVIEPPKDTPDELIAGVPRKDIEALLSEFGFKDAKKPDGRDHYIPRPKVLNMIGTGLKRGLDKWTAEKTTLETETQTMRGQLEELRAGVAGDPKAFLSELATIDPRYKAFLEPQAPTAVQTPPADAEMPQPDLPLPDGSRTYSLEGLQKLLEWNTQRVESKVEARLKPLAEREAQEKARAEQVKTMEAVQTRARQQMEDAKTWPGFAEHETDILKALQQDSMQAKAAGKRPTLTLEAAYRQVVIPRLVADDNARRERILKELNGAPRSTAVARATTDTPRTPSAVSTADIAARNIERFERGA